MNVEYDCTDYERKYRENIEMILNQLIDEFSKNPLYKDDPKLINRMYMENSLFRHCIELIARGSDPIIMMTHVIIMNKELQKTLEDYMKNSINPSFYPIVHEK